MVLILSSYSSDSSTINPLVQELINEYEKQSENSNPTYNKASTKRNNDVTTSLLNRIRGIYPQNKETINPLIKPQIFYQCFSDLPAELVRIILSYYTHSFKDLIKFSTINKTWKQVSDYSLLWLQVDLQFYPSRSFLHQNGCYDYSTGRILQSSLDWKLSYNNFPTLEKQLFSRETVFPPVYKVYVNQFRQDLAQYKINVQESDQEIAYRVGKWWKGLYVEYQRLYNWHVEYVLFLHCLQKPTRMIINIYAYFDFILLFCVGTASIYLLFDCKNTNLSLENKIGFYLLLGLLGFYMILDLICMINCVVEYMLMNLESLYLRVKYSYFGNFDAYFIFIASIFISLLLVLLKCDGLLDDDVDWWKTVLPLWIGFSLLYGLFYREQRKEYSQWNLFIVLMIGAYIAFAPPLTCTLIACDYDHIYTGPFQYTLIPLYPIFFLSFFPFGYCIYRICNVVYNRAQGLRIASRFIYNEWLNSFAYFSVLTLTNICTMINCWSVIMLLIDSYRIDDNDWDKKFFSVHFAPLTCFLIFLFSCPCIYLGIFVESTQFHFEDRWLGGSFDNIYVA